MLRQISALLAGLPTMDAAAFRTELEDVSCVILDYEAELIE